MRTDFAELIYEGPKRLKANALFTARFDMRLQCGIQTGGRLVIAMRHLSDIAYAQLSDPVAENYLAITSNKPDLKWELGPVFDYTRHPWNAGTELWLRAGQLEPGDKVTIILGDQSQGSPGMRCQSFCEAHFGFRLGIDPKGDGDWLVWPEAECPGFQVVGNNPAALRVIVSGAIDAHTNTRQCHLKLEDAYGNVAGVGVDGMVLLLDGIKAVARTRIEPNRAALVQFDAPHDDRWHTIVATLADGANWACSNPFGPSLVEDHHLYWGEIHAQSGLCDGTNSPAEIYAYGREAAGLDFASVTSHDFELSEAKWDQIKKATREAHDPGRFISFLGYEWSGGSQIGGDHNIYFLDDEGPLVHSAPYEVLPPWDPADGEVFIAGKRDLRQTIAELRAGNRPLLVIPHYGGRRANFDFHDPSVMPLYEIHSCHRSTDHVAREALQRGQRMGFIGGSDDHRGALGDCHPAARERSFSSHSGLVGLYAKELTRESLWEAFFAKRAYATNGPRIALAWGINGVLMGGTLSARFGENLHFSLHARLDGMLDHVEIMRDGEFSRRLQGIWNQHAELRFEWDQIAEEGSHSYHAVIFQTDGGKAWSSPVWIDAEN